MEEARNVQFRRELQTTVHLHLLEQVQVENNPLQVHYQHLRSFIQEGLFRYLHGLLLTFLTVVVLNDLWSDELPKTLTQKTQILNLQSQVVEILDLLDFAFTLLTNDLAYGFPLEDPFQISKSVIVLKINLNLPEYVVKELMCILLQRGVDRFQVIVLDGKAELFRIVELLFALTQICIHLLKLIKEVIHHMDSTYLFDFMGLFYLETKD